MKKLFLYATMLAFVLSSCSNDNELGTIEVDTSAIEFRTLNEDKTTNTRAAVTDKDNILSFTVTGQKQSDQGYLFNGFGVTRGESSNWAYSPLRYWPANDKVNFYAYSPTASRNIKTGEGLTDFDYSASAPFTYTVPEIKKNDAQEDFLIARLLDQNEAVGTVNLNFQHALSRVTFSAKTTQKNVTYIITGVELVNLYPSATMDLTDTDIPQTGSFAYSTTTPLLIWDDHATASTSGKTTYSVDKGDAPIYMTTDFTSLLGVTNGLMVMPQTTTLYTGNGTEAQAPATTGTYANQFAIKVAYKAFVDDIYYAGTATTDAVKYFPVKTINSFPNFVFEIGRQYNFFLTFGDEVGKDIKFEVGVSDWDNSTSIFLPEIADYSSLLSEQIKKAINKTSGPITYADLAAVKAIKFGGGTGDVPIASIDDLDGLEYLFALESITIENLSDIPSMILSATHVNLTTINFSYGATIKSGNVLDISKLPATEITLNSNGSTNTIDKLIQRTNQAVAITGTGTITITTIEEK